MKKVLALSLCAAMALTGCAGAAPKGESKSTEAKKLVLSTYGLSEDISAEEVYKPFEDQFGCKIITETGSTNERYTKLSANAESSIDVIELSQAMTAKGIEEGLFEPLDLKKIENSQNLIGTAKTMAEAGQGVAYTINSIGIMYDPEAVGFEIKSFDDLWKAELEGSVAIPDITTTFGPAMVYMASDYKGVDVTSDKGKAAFEALEELKPNLVKTYAKSSDLINMFTSGEIKAAIVGDFGVPTIQKANPNLVFVSPEVTYANFNTISITKNCKDKELAYAYINYRLSKELQDKTTKALNEAPTNNQVTVAEENSKNMTYGPIAENAKVLDYTFVNPVLSDWIDQWNRIINN
ncbi:ABC transporter substrate-binding protein [Lacrimispora algidixylanolytica]|uniref:Spermidine/putrescine ABC transporter substrate-binding protein n=1 Tax=Lacrimispora algidixylanolytica TaxID=94868 RepID=A0A419SZ31_9FIRM|nr:ABC transporter substrate-binding protein [Lacrimispora algidixylanolytica]RKD30465.1 spermidine/putrescine ABC transporter substrate-binding protein [Lacrimispora algidixylanolytica]